jgi:hypothetical protein
MALGIVQFKDNDGPANPLSQVNGVSTQFNNLTAQYNALLGLYTMSDYSLIHTDMGGSDTQGNVFTKQVQANTNQGGGAQSVGIVSAVNIPGDATTADILKTAFTNGAHVEDYQANFIIEVGGVTAAPVIGSNGQAQNALAPGNGVIQSGTIYIAQSQCPAILIGAAMCTSQNGTGTYCPSITSTGMTNIGVGWAFGNLNLMRAAYQLITVQGNYQAIFNQVSTAAEDIACVAIALQGSQIFTAPIAWING